MTCIGSVYAWSIIASELIEKHGLAAYQTQVIFGTLIAVFPLTMIVTGKLAGRVKPRYFGYLSDSFSLPVICLQVAAKVASLLCLQEQAF